MGILKQYWEKLFSWRNKPSGSGGQPATDPEKLEREISAVSHENRTLADEVNQFRSDFEHAREEETRKIVDLEQVRQGMEAARNEDHRKLAELESLNSELEAAREADSNKILVLERRLAVIEAERQRAGERVKALEHSQAETTNQLERADEQIADLQASAVEQAEKFRSSLSAASKRLDTTDDHVSQLELRLKSERQDYLSTFQDLLGRFHKQDVRLNWTLTAAAFALLLGTAVGAVLIWDVQKNAKMLAGMSSDIKALMTTVNQSQTRQPAPQQVKPQPPVSATPPEPGAPVAVKPATGTATQTQTVPPAKDTASKSAYDPFGYFRSNALDGSGVTTRQGLKQFTRKEASSFFEENAKVDGVISLDSGAQYRVVKPGSGKTPSTSDKVVVSYVGTRLDGSVIDETYTEAGPATYSMGEVLPVWRDVLLQMEEGAEFELYVPAKHTTRRNVRKRGISGFQPHIYLIELIEVVKDDEADQTQPVN